MVGGHSNVGTAETQGPTHKALDAPADEMDLPSAKAALDRIVIPEDTVDRIAQMVSPRSSLIISDEGIRFISGFVLSSFENTHVGF